MFINRKLFGSENEEFFFVCLNLKTQKFFFMKQQFFFMKQSPLLKNYFQKIEVKMLFFWNFSNLKNMEFFIFFCVQILERRQSYICVYFINRKLFESQNEEIFFVVESQTWRFFFRVQIFERRHFQFCVYFINMELFESLNKENLFSVFKSQNVENFIFVHILLNIGFQKYFQYGFQLQLKKQYFFQTNINQTQLVKQFS
eukprot:TRINITY_DN73001_c0_g1_i2.p2 TRINITY_DN73001_c0_g1~~TRINITY_DN73001_c0_g1_i2.p2  ORF type:complete len:200 (+),score=12.48 TRINITY_DN73001_c0_g1_i2:128-727(+)